MSVANRSSCSQFWANARAGRRATAATGSCWSSWSSPSGAPARSIDSTASKIEKKTTHDLV